MDNLDTVLATLDTALARILTEPSWAQQLAVATAIALEQDAFIVINEQILNEAIGWAIGKVLTGLPGIVAAEAMTALHEELPEFCTGETADEYAARLRASSRDL